MTLQLLRLHWGWMSTLNTRICSIISLRWILHQMCGRIFSGKRKLSNLMKPVREVRTISGASVPPFIGTTNGGPRRESTRARFSILLKSSEGGADFSESFTFGDGLDELAGWSRKRGCLLSAVAIASLQHEHPIKDKKKLSRKFRVNVELIDEANSSKKPWSHQLNWTNCLVPLLGPNIWFCKLCCVWLCLVLCLVPFSGFALLLNKEVDRSWFGASDVGAMWVG